MRSWQLSIICWRKLSPGKPKRFVDNSGLCQEIMSILHVNPISCSVLEFNAGHVLKCSGFFVKSLDFSNYFQHSSLTKYHPELPFFQSSFLLIMTCLGPLKLLNFYRFSLEANNHSLKVLCTLIDRLGGHNTLL